LLTIPLIAFLSGILRSKTKPARIIQTKFLNSNYPDLWKYAFLQAIVETGFFTSNIYKKNNNLFGMKNASARVQLGTKIDGTDFRFYKNLDQSIEDFFIWLRYTRFPLVNSIREYVHELKKRNYFEESEDYYYKLMVSAYNQYF
jgi:uncharacterized FlgJ-related protein